MYGIHVRNSTLTIQGEGSLEVAAGKNGAYSSGIYVYGNIDIIGATVTATGCEAAVGSRGIYTFGKVTIQNGANVTAVGGKVDYSYGIYCYGITIDNSTCIAKADESLGKVKQAIYICENRKVELINATLESGSASGTSAKWVPKN